MSNLDIHNEYNSSGESVHDLFGRTEEGFFVPLYQREYTWEEDNINQLFDDLVLGTLDLADNPDATTFLGTTILTTHDNKQETVILGEVRAQPTAVQQVIDGQQRISTLALISIQLIVHLKRLRKGLPDRVPYTDLQNAATQTISNLRKLYAISLERGSTPPKKPKIICAREDRWTFNGNDDAYQSPVASYIAGFIRTEDPDIALESLDRVRGARVRGNVKLIEARLNEITDAHLPDTDFVDQFPTGEKITTKRMQEYVLGFTDKKVKSVVDKKEIDREDNNYFAAAIYQILVATYYLLRRCGVNCLQPTHAEWGFDMFQALNATGTPLTVIETFLPHVMQTEQNAGNTWVQTPSREKMDEVQALFDATKTNEQKNKRTNQLLGTFALCYSGKRLGRKFSVQRKWLRDVYGGQLPSLESKRRFLDYLSEVANFYYYAWYMEEKNAAHCIEGLEGHAERNLASLLVQYLKAAHSNLSAPILARFYSQARRSEASFDEFVEATKACAAFFTLWRSSKSTSGLDDVYRRYFTGIGGRVTVDQHHWQGHSSPIKVEALRTYFKGVLQDRGVLGQSAWDEQSRQFLLYSEHKTICRFVLFLAGHDRTIDPSNPGLTSPGQRGSCPLLRLSQWEAKDHKSIEHVAPQNPPSGHSWDSRIYSDNLVDEVGNLILLPLDLNKIADNKDWKVKLLYYYHVGEKSTEKLIQLTSKAQEVGVILSKRATRILAKVEHISSMEPILNVGLSGRWDASLIKKRSQQIRELAFDRLTSWLDV